jgi:putative addiction module component (TIGR02574 family)
LYDGVAYNSEARIHLLGKLTMQVNIDALGITQLSVGERLELIEQIWDSLPEEVLPDDVPPSHLAQLEKRRDNAEREPRLGKPWRDVLGPLEGDS